MNRPETLQTEPACARVPADASKDRPIDPRFVTLLAFGTPFLDGFSTASAAFLIVLLPKLSALEVGTFASLYFVGFFAGSALLAPLADRFGRKPLFTATALLTGLAALVPVFWSALPALFLMRFVTGFALGGDYPVGQALVTENAPSGSRNRHLSFLMFGWYIGALAGVLTALPIMEFDSVGVSFFLLIEAVIAGSLVWGRRKVPESAVWLAARGESKKPSECTAHKAADEATDKATEGLCDSTATRPTQDHWHRDNLSAFVFCSVFWLAQTIPATVLMFYSPDILAAFTGIENAFVGVLMLYGAFLVGVLPSHFAFFAKRPKTVLLATFLAMAASLAVIALWQFESALITGLAFVVFSLAYGLQSPLDFVYPNVLFPAAYRTFFVGMVTTVSRVGTMAIAFVFPALLERFPVTLLFWAGVVLLLAGFLFSLRFAPSDAAMAKTRP